MCGSGEEGQGLTVASCSSSKWTCMTSTKPEPRMPAGSANISTPPSEMTMDSALPSGVMGLRSP